MVRAALGLLLALLGSPAGQDEPGFERVFNGKDWTGIRFHFGEGKTEPGTAFRIDGESIVCSGRPPGYWHTEKTFKEFTLRFDYRYPVPDPVPDRIKGADGKLDEHKFGGNSGYLLFGTEHKVWPKSIEVQGMNRDVLGIIMIRSKGRYTTDREARTKARKPLGEWNAVEIAAKGGQVRCSLNGTAVSTVTEHEFSGAGWIGFQSEGAEIHWRNIRIKAE
jgi:hypothetical protein